MALSGIEMSFSLGKAVVDSTSAVTEYLSLQRLSYAELAANIPLASSYLEQALGIYLHALKGLRHQSRLGRPYKAQLDRLSLKFRKHLWISRCCSSGGLWRLSGQIQSLQHVLGAKGTLTVLP